MQKHIFNHISSNIYVLAYNLGLATNNSPSACGYFIQNNCLW